MTIHAKQGDLEEATKPSKHVERKNSINLSSNSLGAFGRRRSINKRTRRNRGKSENERKIIKHLNKFGGKTTGNLLI